MAEAAATQPKRRKTGGRKAGVPNKAHQQTAERVARSGLTPLQYMLNVMRNTKLPRDVRLKAAKDAAPFVHPRLNSVDHSGKVEGGGAVYIFLDSDDDKKQV